MLGSAAGQLGGSLHNSDIGVPYHINPLRGFQLLHDMRDEDTTRIIIESADASCGQEMYHSSTIKYVDIKMKKEAPFVSSGLEHSANQTSFPVVVSPYQIEKEGMGDFHA